MKKQKTYLWNATDDQPLGELCGPAEDVIFKGRNVWDTDDDGNKRLRFGVIGAKIELACRQVSEDEAKEIEKHLNPERPK